MASDRAVKFAEMQVWADGDEPQSLWVGGRSVAISDTRDWIDVAQAKVAVSEMLDAYEREAWVEITDDPGTWPPRGQHVLFAHGSEVSEGYLSFVGSEYGNQWRAADLTGVDRPTHWRPMVEWPR